MMDFDGKNHGFPMDFPKPWPLEFQGPGATIFWGETLKLEWPARATDPIFWPMSKSWVIGVLVPPHNTHTHIYIYIPGGSKCPPIKDT